MGYASRPNAHRVMISVGPATRQLCSSKSTSNTVRSSRRLSANASRLLTLTIGSWNVKLGR